MTTPFKDNYGFGLVVRTVDGHKLITHGGGIEDFNTSLNYYPDPADARLTVIVLGNLNGGTSDQIASSLGKVALGQTVVLPSERKAVTLSPETLSRYVGTYRMTDAPLDNVVAIKDGHLTTKLGNQPELELFPESETKFFLQAQPITITFVRNAAGAVSHLLLVQGGTETRAAKVK